MVAICVVAAVMGILLGRPSPFYFKLIWPMIPTGLAVGERGH